MELGGRGTYTVNNNIYLIGFMGAGKTTIGKKLGQTISYRFLDLDDWIIVREGKSIPEIFNQHGEAAFRKMETDALKSCSEEQKLVIATGGGIVEKEENIEYMKKTGSVIFLDADFSSIYERIKTDPNRPLTKEGVDGLAKRYSNRLPLYRQAHHIINTDGKTVDDVLEQIKSILIE